MKTIIQNLATEYEETGTGKAVLLLHGWKDSLHTFDTLIPFLNSNCKIIRLDLPGFGQSENPKETWNIDRYVSFTKAFLDKLNIETTAIIGHSFGGRVAIKGISSGILKCDKIILIGSAGLAKSNSPRNLLIKFIAKLGGFFMNIPPFNIFKNKLRKRLYSSIGSDYMSAGALKETFKKVIAEDLTECARKISVPTLLIWGANDVATPLADGRMLRELIRGSKLEVISNAGHFVHQEKSAEVGELIEGFLR